jgi:hypothetical protein
MNKVDKNQGSSSNCCRVESDMDIAPRRTSYVSWPTPPESPQPTRKYLGTSITITWHLNSLLKASTNKGSALGESLGNIGEEEGTSAESRHERDQTCKLCNKSNPYHKAWVVVHNSTLDFCCQNFICCQKFIVVTSKWNQLPWHLTWGTTLFARGKVQSAEFMFGKVLSV